MSNRMRRRRAPKWQRTATLKRLADGPDPRTQLELIFENAPDGTFLGEGKMAVYSATCCWWSSNPHTVGKTPNAGLPGCPHCGSPLFQAPLREFIDKGSSEPEHYGPAGLAAFVAAHGSPCHQQWEEYVDA